MIKRETKEEKLANIREYKNIYDYIDDPDEEIRAAIAATGAGAYLLYRDKSAIVRREVAKNLDDELPDMASIISELLKDKDEKVRTECYLRDLGIEAANNEPNEELRILAIRRGYIPDPENVVDETPAVKAAYQEYITKYPEWESDDFTYPPLEPYKVCKHEAPNVSINISLEILIGLLYESFTLGACATQVSQITGEKNFKESRERKFANYIKPIANFYEHNQIRLPKWYDT